MLDINKKKIAFIVDSSCNIKPGQFDDVYVVPLGITVTKDGKTKAFRDNGSEVSVEDIKKYFKENYAVKTTQALMSDMCSQVEAIQDKYDRIIVLPIARTLSGNAGSWELLKSDYSKLSVINLDDVAAGYGWTVEIFRKLLTQKSMSDEDLQDFVETNLRKSRVGFLLINDLSQLIKSGRLKGYKAAFAQLLKLKPVIKFSPIDGLQFLDKVRTQDGFFTKIEDFMKKTYSWKKIVKVAILSPSKNPLEDDFTKLFKKHYPNVEIEYSPIPLVIGVHTGLDYNVCFFKLDY